MIRAALMTATLLIGAAGAASGQAVVPAPGGHPLPITRPIQPPAPPGPAPQGGTAMRAGKDAVVPAPRGNPPPVVRPVGPTPPPGPAPE